LFHLLTLKKLVGVIISIAMAFLPSLLHAQKYFSGHNEWGFSTGLSNYYGDFSKGLNTKHFKPSGAIYQKYNFTSYFALRNQISYLEIEGTSADVKGLAFQNLNFQSKIYEASSMVEFNFHPFGMNINDGVATPYFLLGLSGFGLIHIDLTKRKSICEICALNSKNVHIVGCNRVFLSVLV